MKKRVRAGTRLKRGLGKWMKGGQARRIMLPLMGIFVACITLSSLLLPGITLERIATCGYPDHEHDESCYRVCGQEESNAGACSFVPHVHSQDCYDENGQLLCGYSEIVFHTHNSFCYDREGKLVCALEDNPVHVHGENCIGQTSVCGKAEYTHTDA